MGNIIRYIQNFQERAKEFAISESPELARWLKLRWRDNLDDDAAYEQSIEAEPREK